MVMLDTGLPSIFMAQGGTMVVKFRCAHAGSARPPVPRGSPKKLSNSPAAHSRGQFCLDNEEKVVMVPVPTLCVYQMQQDSCLVSQGDQPAYQTSNEAP